MPTAASQVWRPSSARSVVLDGFVPVPRGVVAAAPAPLVWPSKDPSDVLDYEFDVSAALVGQPGDTIATIDVAIAPNANSNDLALVRAAADGAVAVMWFSGGVSGTTYTVTLTIGTVAGRVVARAVLLPVQALSSATVPATSLTSTQGAVITDQNGNPILIGS